MGFLKGQPLIEVVSFKPVQGGEWQCVGSYSKAVSIGIIPYICCGTIQGKPPYWPWSHADSNGFSSSFRHWCKDGIESQEFGSKDVGVVPDFASRPVCTYLTFNLSQRSRPRTKVSVPPSVFVNQDNQ